METIKALITGASGVVGGAVAEVLQAEGHSVVRLDRNGSTGVAPVDLLSPRSALRESLKATRPHVVYHCAAVISGPDETALFHDNVMMAMNLTQAIGEMPAAERPALVNLSSAAEIGAVPDSIEFVDEEIRCAPVSAYGVSKYCQTQVALAAARRYGFRCVCARLFNLLPGTRGQPVYSWIAQLRAIKEGKQPPVLRTGDLNVLRDFIDMKAAATIIARLGLTEGAHGIVNVASGRATSLRSVVKKLSELSGVKFELDDTSVQFNGIRRVVADVRKLNALIGEPDLKNLDSMLQDAIHELF